LEVRGEKSEDRKKTPSLLEVRDEKSADRINIPLTPTLSRQGRGGNTVGNTELGIYFSLPVFRFS
jgi:hypothetical protein